MIILRQKQYATGVERTMVAMNKIPKPSIKEKAKEISREQRKSAVKKINQTLGKEGLEKSSIGGFFRGKSTRARVKMGYNTPEAVEHLRKKKIAEALKDKSTSPEAIEEKLRETLGQKIKKAGKNVVEKTKGGAKAVYADTSKTAGKAVGFVVGHPGYAVSQTALTFGPAAVLTPAQYGAYTAASSATHPGTAAWGAGKWITDDIPIKKALRNADGKRVRDASGKVIKKKIPLGKVVKRWGRVANKKIVDMFEGKGLKGSTKRILNTVKESHKASHPYENRVPAV